MLNKIRELRKALGISQEELAKKCGVSRQTVNAIENNKYDPTLALAFRLARELRVTVDGLFVFHEGRMLEIFKGTVRPGSADKRLPAVSCPEVPVSPEWR